MGEGGGFTGGVGAGGWGSGGGVGVAGDVKGGWGAGIDIFTWEYFVVMYIMKSLHF